jgi:hypothetical protein
MPAIVHPPRRRGPARRTVFRVPLPADSLEVEIPSTLLMNRPFFLRAPRVPIGPDWRRREQCSFTSGRGHAAETDFEATEVDRVEGAGRQNAVPSLVGRRPCGAPIGRGTPCKSRIARGQFAFVISLTAICQKLENLNVENIDVISNLGDLRDLNVENREILLINPPLPGEHCI